MFRLYFLVFEGAPRFDTAYVHPHESPGVMTLPLIVLAAASLLVGLLVGWPPENGFIHHFLEPAFEHGAAEEHHVEAGLTLTNSILATLAAVGGLALAFLMYRRGSPSPAALGARFQRLYRFLLGKWYFDEIYDTAFVRGTRDVAFGSWFFDRHVIDGLVNGTAAAVVGASGQLRRLQTGFVGNYALAIAFGLVLFVGIYLVTAALR
jgi:NADH-quinone oxidoreductase subunit L